jgi:predicted  nucleic acid-binding Zn-ribbon protein
MERRITSLEQFSLIAAQAMQELDEAVLRMEASMRRSRESIQQSQVSMEELDVAMRRSETSIRALMEFVPVIQAEVVRLDTRIDRIEES